MQKFVHSRVLIRSVLLADQQEHIPSLKHASKMERHPVICRNLTIKQGLLSRVRIGKTKCQVSKHTLEDEALNNENVKKFILGKQIVKIVSVKNKMVNIVVK
jgi:leucyl-tRNA synthetase